MTEDKYELFKEWFKDSNYHFVDSDDSFVGRPFIFNKFDEEYKQRMVEREIKQCIYDVASRTKVKLTQVHDYPFNVVKIYDEKVFADKVYDALKEGGYING